MNIATVFDENFPRITHIDGCGSNELRAIKDGTSADGQNEGVRSRLGHLDRRHEGIEVRVGLDSAHFHNFMPLESRDDLVIHPVCLDGTSPRRAGARGIGGNKGGEGGNLSGTEDDLGGILKMKLSMGMRG